MIYKLNLSDNSFIIVDETYNLKLFYGIFHKNLSIKEFLSTNKYKNYYLIDCIDNKKIKRTFTIEEIKNSEISIGSRIKLVKDIQIGDLIQGVDGLPRRVKELHTGEDEMFEISIDGKSYIVNGGHILELVDKTTNEHIEIPVNVYMHMDNEFKSHYVMEKIEEE